MQRARLIPLIFILIAATLALLATRSHFGSPAAEPDVPVKGAPQAPPRLSPTPDLLAAATSGGAREEVEAAELEHAVRAREPARIDSALHGRVVDAVTGQAIGAFQLLIVQPPSAKTSLATDENGAFTFPPLREGTITLTWPGDGRPLRFGELVPNSFVFGEPGTARGDEILFRLTQSEPKEVCLELEFAVLRPDGTPAGGAGVALNLRPKDEPNGWRCVSRELADDGGQVRFSLDAAECERVAMAEATLGDKLIGRTEQLSPPLTPGPWPLHLELGGSLRARVVDGHGRPLRSAFVSLTPSRSQAHPSTRTRSLWMDVWRGKYTDLQGQTVFAPLPAMAYEVAVQLDVAGASTKIPAEVVTVQAGADIEWTRAIEIERATGVAGRVVDEQGQGLPELPIDIFGTAGVVRVTTDEAGHFEHVTFVEDTLVVLPDPFGDLYAPAYAEVAFGAAGLQFRRVGVLEDLTISLLVSDRGSGDPVQEFVTNLYLDTPRAHYGTWTGSGGVGLFEAKFPPGTRVLLLAQGYLPLDASVGSLLAERTGNEPVRLELERGFRLPVMTLDTLTGKPLPGVQFSAPGAPVATTDDRGVVLLEGSFPPNTYRVECAGYETEQFSAAKECMEEDFYLSPADVGIYLMPVQAGTGKQ